MNAIIQQVSKASLSVNEKVVSSINSGVIIFVGVHRNDTETDVVKLANRIVKMRTFKDENNKLNLNILDVGGEILLVSNFTLQADHSHGNRPNFSFSAEYSKAEGLYLQLQKELLNLGVKTVKLGVFGEMMYIDTELVGPVNFIIDSHQM